MAFAIETFQNADLSHGWQPGNDAKAHVLFKALGHPQIAEAGRSLAREIATGGPVAIIDLLGSAQTFQAFYDISGANIQGYYVQRVEDLSRTMLGRKAAPLTDLADANVRTVFVAAFDSERLLKNIRHLLPANVRVLSFDNCRLPQDMLTNKSNYLDPLNFATNFGLLRDRTAQGASLHTRITTANYWGSHGAEAPRLWLCLFDEGGKELARWVEPLSEPGALIEICSVDVRRRFGLRDFTGSLFMHAINVAGHDVVKYALDVYGDEGHALSCSHDANAWPADYYSGVPAPDSDETLTLFVQNSHPVAIPKQGIGVNVMGSTDISWFDEEVPAFGTTALDVGRLLPRAKFPDQIEIVAGRYFVRPRYEVVRRTNEHAKRRIAHANVERTDLKADPDLPTLGKYMGKGYIVALPVPHASKFQSVMLPTPMARSQAELPVRVELFDAAGERVAERYLGRVDRRESCVVDVDALLGQCNLATPFEYGHVEFLYDWRNGGSGDGWLHALGRYEQRSSGHRAETIFGSHIFNTPIIYKNEPQSYVGKPPGLTTRLFLRLGTDQADGDLDTFCHLIYPASLPWRVTSSTKLILVDRTGKTVSERELAIPCGGSRLWRAREMFSAAELSASGAYVLVRDETCRLFGYHGLINGDTSFSLDHMFGF